MNNSAENKNEGHGQEKEYVIYVNTRKKIWQEKEISYEQVVWLAFDNPPTGDNVSFVITYRRGHGDKPEGTLIPGQIVKIKEEMIFDVSPNNKS